MKKFGYFVAIMALMAAACTKQEVPAEPQTPENNNEKVYIELKVTVAPETRATMGSDKKLSFGKNDQISVIGTKGSTTSIITLEAKSIDSSTGEITFQSTTEVDTDTQIGEYAYYPHDLIVPDGDNPINPLQILWPSTFWNKTEGSVVCPMMAKIDLDNNTAVFSHLGSLLKVNVVDFPAAEGWIEFRTSNKFVGHYSVSPNLDDNDSTNDWSMKLNADATYDTNFEGFYIPGSGIYYIPVPAGSYADFQLGMVPENDYAGPVGAMSYYKQRTANLNGSTITPARKQIVNLGDFTYDVDSIEEYYLVCKANNWDYSDRTIRMIKCGDNEYIGATWNGKWVSDSDDTRGFKVATADSDGWSKVYGNSTNYQSTGIMTLGGNFNGLWTNSDDLYSALFNSSTKGYSTEDKGNGNNHQYSGLCLNWDGNDTAMTMTASGTHHWMINDFTVANNSEHKFYIKNPSGWPRCANTVSVSDSAPYCAVGSHVADASGNECTAVLTPGDYDVYYNDITGNIMFVRQ